MDLQTKQLSIIDQTICRHYVRVALCFPFSAEYDVEPAVRQIKDGLIRTFQQTPYLAGCVSFSSNPARDGPLVVQYPDQVVDVLEPVFVVRRFFGSEDPAYTELVGAGVPPSELPGSKFGPLPDSPDLNSPSPVLGVCAAFIRGGLILTIYAQHSVLDGRGLGFFLEDFGSNVRSAGLPSMAWLPSWWTSMCDYGKRFICPIIVPAFRNWRPPSDKSMREWITNSAVKASQAVLAPICPEFLASDVPSPAKPFDDTKSAVGYIFVCGATKLRTLRDNIAKFWHEGDNPSRRTAREKIPLFPDIRISTWDAIAALIWVSVTKARSPLHRLHETTKFGFTIDCRKRLPVQLTDRFMGNAALYTYADFPIAEFTNSTGEDFETIAKAALHIRLANMQFTETAVKDRLSYFAQLPEQEPPANAVDSTFGPDVFMTSWQEMGPCANFGIHGTIDSNQSGTNAYEAGMPTHIRKPGCRPTDGGIILLPRRKIQNAPDDAPFEIMIQIRDDHMMNLLQNDRFMQYIERVVT